MYLYQVFACIDFYRKTSTTKLLRLKKRLRKVKNMKNRLMAICLTAAAATAAAIAGATLAGCSSGNTTDSGQTTHSDTTDTTQKTFCQIVAEITGKTVATTDDAPYYFTIGSDDSYCTIDTNPLDLDDYTSTTALNYIDAMNEALGLPEYLMEDMMSTSYSQGKQEETFTNFKVKYYYHPDKGLNVTYYRIYS